MQTKTLITFHDGADPIDTETFETGMIEVKPGTIFRTWVNGVCFRYEIIGVTRSDEFYGADPLILTNIRVTCKGVS